jgi:hypothetical protein
MALASVQADALVEERLIVDAQGVSIGPLSVQIIKKRSSAEIIGCESNLAGILGFPHVLGPDVLNHPAVDLDGIVGLLNFELNLLLQGNLQVGGPLLLGISPENSSLVAIEYLQRKCDTENETVVDSVPLIASATAVGSVSRA